MGILRRIHRWLGLTLAVPLVLQGLSGTILALEPVLPGPAAGTATAGEPRDANAIVEAAAAAVAPGLRVTRYLPAIGPRDAAQVVFAPREGPARGAAVVAWVDPVTLWVLRHGPEAGGMLAWIKAWHTNLLTTDRSGRSVIGWLGVGLLILAVLGIPLWWPVAGQWCAAFLADRTASGWTFHRRLHGAAGAWSAVLLLATAATGVMLAFPQTVRSVLGLLEASAPRRMGAASEAPGVDVARAIAVAQMAAPDARVRMVLLPARADDVVRVMLVPEGSEGAAAATTVTVDVAASRILTVQNPQSMAFGERVMRWAHDLHFGQGFGPAWRMLTIATGLVLPVFGATGVAMWLKRRRRGTMGMAAQQAGE